MKCFFFFVFGDSSNSCASETVSRDSGLNFESGVLPSNLFYVGTTHLFPLLASMYFPGSLVCPTFPFYMSILFLSF